MKICRKCGKELQQSSNFCPACGQKQNLQTGKIVPHPGRAATAIPAKIGKKSGMQRVLKILKVSAITIIIAIGLIAIVKVALYAFGVYTLFTAFDAEDVENINNAIDSWGESLTEEESEFSIYEISVFQQERVKALLEKNKLTDYTVENGRRHYSHTAEDYAKILELDETYLYGFYTLTSRATLDEVCKALGYTDIKDYLIQKQYVDSEGNPDVHVWYKQNKKDMIVIMREQKKK